MLKAFQSNSYLFGGNAPYVEELYESYLNNPGSVPEHWREYFDNLQVVPASDGNPQTRDVAHAPIVQSFAERAKEGALQPRQMGGDASTATSRSTSRAWSPPTGSSARAGLTSTPSSAGAPVDSGAGAGLLRLHRGRPGERLFRREHVFRLRQRAAARHRARAARDLLRHARRRVHVHQRPGAEALAAGAAGEHPIAPELLARAAQAHPGADHRRRGLEKYLHTRYVGQKRFSLEGGESSSRRWTS